MVNLDLISALIFYGLLLLIFFLKREKFDVQGKVFVMYKTLFGLRLMDKIAKKIPKLLKFLSFIGIIVGFFGMVFIFYFLIKGTYQFLFKQIETPVIAPVFPGVSIPGAPPLSFWHWIIAIFIVAVVHEFSHGVIARVYNIKVKSSGFAFLGPILAAFVEPDEKVMQKRSIKTQLSIVAAGPFANIILAGIVILVTPFLFSFLFNNFDSDGVWVAQIGVGFPVDKAGVNVGEKILNVNNNKVNNVSDFVNALDDLKKDDKIILETDKKVYSLIAVENPTNESRGYIGIHINNFENQQTYGILLWLFSLFSWIFIINLGVGLFNLLPLGPVDGGRMFHSALTYFTKDKKKAFKIWGLVSLFVLFLILINLTPYFVKLFGFLFKVF